MKTNKEELIDILNKLNHLLKNEKKHIEHDFVTQPIIDKSMINPTYIGHEYSINIRIVDIPQQKTPFTP